MTRINLSNRSIKGTPKTLTIVLNKSSDEGNTAVESAALYALLGGYNEVARNVDVDLYHALQSKFNNLVIDMAALIAES